MKKHLNFAAVVCAAALILPFSGARGQTPEPPSNTGCDLDLQATVPLVESARRYLAPVKINGETRLFIVDTGAEKTLLTPAAADALQLGSDTSHTERIGGAGESVGPQYDRVVESLALGPSEWVHLRLPTAKLSISGQTGTSPPVAGLLGADILSRYDVELDFPAKTMKLYSAQNCLGRFAPWTGDYNAYSPEYTRRHIFVMSLALNGHPIRATLDTGAAPSLLTYSAARAAGVDDAALRGDPTGSGRGVSGTPFNLHWHRFESLRAGNATFHFVPIQVGDVSLSTDMLLGMDFLKGRRIWLSYSTGWVFTQQASGPPAIASAQPQPDSSSGPPLDVEAQLAIIDREGAGPSELPASRLRQFSTHSHMTYYRPITVRTGGT